MIYTVYARFIDSVGDVGFASHDRTETMGLARCWAEQALLALDNAVNEIEWFDAGGNPTDGWSLHASTEPDDVELLCSQLNDALQARDAGHFSVAAYESLQEFIEAASVLSWCSTALRERILAWQAEESALVSAIAGEWSV